MARQNDHTRAEELISAYLDKRVSAEEQDFFERHIASCAECHAQLEATRSLVAALRAMPVVRAPRSFVLPREMAKQPRRSFLSWYPALRLATVIAAMAFVVLFAGDVLISRSSGAGAPSIPAAPPGNVAMQAPQAAPPAAPTQEPAAAKTAADTAAAPAPAAMQAPAAAPTFWPTLTATAAAVAAERSAAPAAGAALQLSATASLSESAALSLPAATPPAAASADSARLAQKVLKATPTSARPVLDQQALPAAEPSAPAIDPLRVAEIAALALAVVLGVATLVVRRKQV